MDQETKFDEDFTRHFKTLDLQPEASVSEIETSYRKLKEQFSSTTEPDSSGSEDKDQGERDLKAIENAYCSLMTMIAKRNNDQSDLENTDHMEEQAEITKDSGRDIFSGSYLRKTREKLNIELDAITQETKVQKKSLMMIEEEQFDQLPPEIYIRGFVTGYAKCVSLDPNKAAAGYLERYRAWKKGAEKHRGFRFSGK